MVSLCTSKSSAASGILIQYLIVSFSFFTFFYLFLSIIFSNVFNMCFVQVISSSHNVLIYLCVGNRFTGKLLKIRQYCVKQANSVYHSKEECEIPLFGSRGNRKERISSCKNGKANNSSIEQTTVL